MLSQEVDWVWAWARWIVRGIKKICERGWGLMGAHGRSGTQRRRRNSPRSSHVVLSWSSFR